MNKVYRYTDGNINRLVVATENRPMPADRYIEVTPDMMTALGFQIQIRHIPLRDGRLAIFERPSPIDEWSNQTILREDDYFGAPTEQTIYMSTDLPIAGSFQTQPYPCPDIDIIDNSLCIFCGKNVCDNPDFFTWDEDKLVCKTCALRNTFVCSECGKEGDINEMEGLSVPGRTIDPRDGVSKTNRLCSGCYSKSYISCTRCEGSFSKDGPIWEGKRNHYCEGCSEEILQGFDRPLRDIKDIPKQEAESGEIIRSKRRAGVEIECQWSEIEDYGKAFLHVPYHIGIGTDGSVNGNGAELRTPPAAGDTMEDLIKKTCDALNQNNFSVDASCGLHVHIDVEDIDRMSPNNAFKNVRDLWAFYTAFEDVIMSFLPPSRRENRYCKTMKASYNVSEILRANNMSQLEQLWYRTDDLRSIQRIKAEHRHETRYYGINLHTLLSARHIEIRFHSGTLNARKIMEWVNLHCRIVDVIFNQGVSTDWLLQMAASSNLSKKTAEFLDFLVMPDRSVNYFLARQKAFYQEPKFIESESFKEAADIINSEKEN